MATFQPSYPQTLLGINIDGLGFPSFPTGAAFATLHSGTFVPFFRGPLLLRSLLRLLHSLPASSLASYRIPLARHRMANSIDAHCLHPNT